MVSAVKSRPNHYEMLGLTPDANSAEIAQAFARELGMLRPRAFGTLAEVTVAYATLRDPAKRQAYDRSLGFAPEPPAPAPEVPSEWAPFLLRVHSAKPVEPPTEVPLRAIPPPETSRPRPELRPPPRTAPSATALLHQPIRPDPRDIQPIIRTKAEDLLRPSAFQGAEQEEPKPVVPLLEPEAIEDQAWHSTELERDDDAGGSSPNWRLPALAAGGALLVAVGVGAWTGWEAGNDNGLEQSEQAATIKVPPANTLSAGTDSSSVPVPGVIEEHPERSTPSVAASRTTDLPATRRPAVSEDKQVEAAQPGQGEEIVAEVDSGDSSVETASTKMPLSNAVIARTLGRIGYSCGQVASTSPIEGSAGAFKVTCTSGQSYRAAPVRGRYHFRRLSGR